jgi:hypothetical protein
MHGATAADGERSGTRRRDGFVVSMQSKPSFQEHVMRSFSSRAALAALAAIALGACNDRVSPTEAAGPRFAVVGDSTTLGISALTLSRDSAFINGPAVPYTATLSNPGGTLSGVAIQGWIVQGSLRHGANGTLINCGSGSGVLPSGTCTVSFSYAASNGLSGAGTLVPGAATLELDLEDGTGTVVSTVSVPVTLLPNHPIVTGITLSSDTVFIGGRVTSYTATLENPNGNHSGVAIQGFIAQGSVTHAAGGTLVNCGAGIGVLPTGTCIASSSAGASNGDLTGAGTLVPGTATFLLQLKDSAGNIVDTRTKTITLAPPTPRITALTLSSTSATIDGPTVPFTTTLDNPGLTSHSGVSIQGFVRQGTTLRAANGTLVNCGSGAGVLPVNSCTVSFELSASNSGGGSGTLVPGGATFELDLRDSTGAVWNARTVAITLVAKSISITTLTLSSDTAIIGGSGNAVPYTMTINNPGSAQQFVIYQSNIIQGTAKRAAGSGWINCTGSIGVLPTGDCTQHLNYVASNGSTGSGTLVAGSASLVIDVINAASGKLLATRTVPVVLKNP